MNETERGNNILTKVATYFYVNWILDWAYKGRQLMLPFKVKFIGKGKCVTIGGEKHTQTYTHCEDRAEILKSEFSFWKTSKYFIRSHLLIL